MATVEERFEAKVDRTDECHLWTGAKTAAGYGQMRVAGKLRTSAQIAWEIANGELSLGARVVTCPANRLCVRVDHLQVEVDNRQSLEQPTARADRGSGSMREVASGKWKLTVDVGRDDKNRRRRVTRTVRGSRRDAARALAVLGAEVQSGERRPTAEPAQAGQWFAVDDLIDWYIAFARDVRGLERTTVFGYAEVYRMWLKHKIGHINAERLSPADIDNAFGVMRQAGLSHSRMNNARAVLSGAYKWGRRHGKVSANPMRGFELPKSKKAPKRTTAPEIDELLMLLSQAADTDPELSAVLTLAATTGMRRGELSALRRDRINLDRGELRVDQSISEIDGELEEKPTKTHDTRTVRLDQATIEFLHDHLNAMDQRASQLGFAVDDNGFVFSLEPDCSQPMRPELMTRRMRRLKRPGFRRGSVV